MSTLNPSISEILQSHTGLLVVRGCWSNLYQEMVTAGHALGVHPSMNQSICRYMCETARSRHESCPISSHSQHVHLGGVVNPFIDF
jgi:hypothetical protein